jgi:hypothetical protein
MEATQFTKEELIEQFKEHLSQNFQDLEDAQTILMEIHQRHSKDFGELNFTKEFAKVVSKLKEMKVTPNDQFLIIKAQLDVTLDSSIPEQKISWFKVICKFIWDHKFKIISIAVGIATFLGLAYFGISAPVNASTVRLLGDVSTTTLIPLQSEVSSLVASSGSGILGGILTLLGFGTAAVTATILDSKNDTATILDSENDTQVYEYDAEELQKILPEKIQEELDKSKELRNRMFDIRFQLEKGKQKRLEMYSERFKKISKNTK